MGSSFLDTMWLLLCASLVFVMQAGFMCLEAGLTRSKNSINVAIKNLTDFGTSVILFWIFGFALMFGQSRAGLIGVTGWFYPDHPTDGWKDAFFLFEAMFCATSATILSGAVAERMRYSAYILATVIVAGVIYPIYGHWAWNGISGESPTGWLGAYGFVDFAGSTVVHRVGGWVALATLIVVGPRVGRFLPEGGARKIIGSNLPLSMLGVLLLWIGWMGFNGGSTLGFDEQAGGLMVKTILAGSAGALSALLVGWIIQGVPNVHTLMYGSIAGLVAITGSCHVVSTPSALLIGGIGGLVMLAVEYLVEACKLDDAVGAVSVHLGGGVWGTFAVAIFGNTEALGTGLDRWGQLKIQSIGIAVCFLWAFCLSYVLLLIFNRFVSLRVTPYQEQIGLNVSEHGATTELWNLLSAIDQQAKSGDMNFRVPVEPFTEIGQIARQYNHVMDKLQTSMSKLEDRVAERTAELNASNKELEAFTYSVSHDLRAPLRHIDGFVRQLSKRERSRLDSTSIRFLDIIVQSTERMGELIDTLLTLSRVGRGEIKRKRVELEQLVRQVKEELEAHEHNRRIVWKIDPLPKVEGDPALLRSVWMNLLSNAIKYTGPRQEARIEIGTQVNDAGSTLFYVRDNGIGFDPQYTHKLFGVFQRLHRQEDFPGTGIGLATVRRIIHRHGGDVWAQSQLNEGTTLYFTLKGV